MAGPHTGGSPARHRPASPAACCRAGWPARSSGRGGCHWHRRGCDAWSPACRDPSGSGRSPRPPFCWNAGAVHRCTIPVDGVGIAEPVEQHTMQPFPHASPMPLVQTPPAGHPRAAAHLHRQKLPRDARAQHEQDAGQRRTIVQPGTSAFRLGRLRRDQRFDDRPQGVGNKRGCHAPTNRSWPVLLRTLKSRFHQCHCAIHWIWKAEGYTLIFANVGSRCHSNDCSGSV